MIRIRGRLVVLQVATGARGVGDVVVSVHVAQTALHVGMSSRQGPSGLRVVVRRWAPANCGMADLALLRNSSRHVIRIGCALVIPQMASDARCAGEIKVPVAMALLTLQLGVPSG